LYFPEGRLKKYLPSKEIIEFTVYPVLCSAATTVAPIAGNPAGPPTYPWIAPDTDVREEEEEDCTAVFLSIVAYHSRDDKRSFSA
jgi:hypothetical protein